MSDTGIYARRRLDLLEAVAYAADDPLVAVIGAATGEDLIALAKGVRRPHPMRKGSAAGSVICFTGQREQTAMRAAQEVLTDYANAQTRRRRKFHTSTPVALVVRFVLAEDVQRVAWQQEIARLQGAGPLRFGLIVHAGSCRDGRADLARRDLDLFVPMMSDRTTLVLCGLEKSKPPQLLRSLLVNGGFDGVWKQSLGLAVLGRRPFSAAGVGMFRNVS